MAAGRPVLAAKVTGAAAGPSAAGLPLGPAQPNWRRIPKERKGGRRLQGRSSLGGAAAPSPAAHGRDLKKSTGSDAATDWVQLRGVPCGLPLLAPCLRQKQQEGCSNPAIGMWAGEGAGLLAGSGSNSLQYGKNTARPGQGRAGVQGHPGEQQGRYSRQTPGCGGQDGHGMGRRCGCCGAAAGSSWARRARHAAWAAAAVPRQHPAASFVEAVVRAAGGPPGL